MKWMGGITNCLSERGLADSQSKTVKVIYNVLQCFTVSIITASHLYADIH